MTPAERYKAASEAMKTHIMAMNAIEVRITNLRKSLQEMKKEGWPLREEYRIAHQELLVSVAGESLPNEFIPPTIVDHDLEPDGDEEI